MKFYSDVTKKLYDTEDALIAAEKEVAAEEEKKAKEAKAKKADAKKVEEAFKVNNDAKREFNAKVLAARKMYNESLAAAKKAFDSAVADATNAKEAADEEYDKVLNEFIEKHPEGYHLTLKDGDNVVTYSSQAEQVNSIVNDFNGLIDYMLKNLF
jgi:membrane protein involved in colicin uptake